MTILVFFIKKKNSSLHLVQDYKNLNILTTKTKYYYDLGVNIKTKIYLYIE